MEKDITKTKYYKAGYDSIMNGSNEKNCNYTLFDTPEHTKLWERGMREAQMWKAVQAYLKDKGFAIIVTDSPQVASKDKYKFTFSFDFVGNYTL
jgi:hypothetical protein